MGKTRVLGIFSIENKCLRLPILVRIIIVFLALSSPAVCAAAQSDKPLVVDSQTRKRIIDKVISELQLKYIAPERVKNIESKLRVKLQSGEFDKIENPRQFASTITQDLRTADNDLHLFITYDPVLERAIMAAPQTPTVDLQELPPSEERLAELRQSNYNFRKLEIMRGNVGYLDLRSFVDLNYSKDTAAAAMNFLSNADAVIIDLRKNPGGFINLEIFLASYFYGVDPIELLSRYHREGNVTVKEWTIREVPGKRLQYTDLYILTSKETGSAAEAFSFILQQRKRAKVIGERTSGAGYGNKEYALGEGFVFFISVFRQFDPRTGRGWQDVGVEPDIAVPAEQALSAAHLEAIKELAAKTKDEHKKQQLSWLAPLLDLEMNGAKQVPKPILEKYVGKYTPQITVSIEKEQLYFLGASGVKRRLLALGEDYFLIEDASVSPENQARLRFVRNAAGAVTELQLMVADGRTFPRVREG